MIYLYKISFDVGLLAWIAQKMPFFCLVLEVNPFELSTKSSFFNDFGDQKYWFFLKNEQFLEGIFLWCSDNKLFY